MGTGESDEKISRRTALQRGGLVIGGAIFGLSSVSTATAEPTEVDRCMAITEPGEYILTDDLDANGDCLTLGPGVTLNGNGHTISGTGSGIGLSFELDSEERAVVRDLRVTGFGAGAATRSRTSPSRTTLREFAANTRERSRSATPSSATTTSASVSAAPLGCR